MNTQDIQVWQQYKKSPTPANRQAALRQFDGIINAQVNKWAGGNIPRDVLYNKAKLLAAEGLDTYDPKKGTALATHLTNSMMPLSRTVYTYSNTARIPENITMKLSTYNNAVNDFVTLNGREPTTDELHDALGWKASEITRVRDYNVRDLVESGGDVKGRFYEGNTLFDTDDAILGGIYMDLLPDDKRIFEYTTGYNGAPILKVPEIAKKLNMTVAQVAYKKTLMRKKIADYMNRPGIKSKYGK